MYEFLPLISILQSIIIHLHFRIRVNSMDNIITFNQNDIESYLIYTYDEQERKVNTPYVEPQDIYLENSLQIKPISQKIQFTLNDIAMAKKAKSRKTKTIDDPNSNKKCGHWSSDQNKRYHWFLELHHEHFFNKHLRRTDRIFKSMATFVETRQAEQCRSHHQKMEKKYKYFSKILMSLRLQNYNCDDSDLIIQEMQQKIENIGQISILSSIQLKMISESSSLQQKQSESHTQPKTPKKHSIKSQNTAITLPSSTPSFQQIVEQENKQAEQQIFGEVRQLNHNIDNIFDDTYQKNIQLGGLF